MKRSAMKLLLVLAFASSLVFPAVASEEIAQLKATVVKVEGDVRIRGRGSLFSHDAKANEILSAGAQIETKEKSRIELRLENGNVINLKPKSKLVLKTLTRDLKTGDYENLLEVNKGGLRAKVEKIKGKSRFEVKSPTAVACVRGTIMYLLVYPDSTTAFFEEGVGFVTNPFSGKDFNVNPGNVYQIDENGNVTGPVTPTPQQLQDIIEGWDVGAGGEGYSGGEGGDDLGGYTGPSDNSGDAMNDISNNDSGSNGNNAGGGTNTSDGTGTITETDTDGDGIPDSIDEDDDGDGMTDVYENNNDLNPLVNDAALDKDEDDLTNLEEFNAGTYANNPDSDDDNFSDGAEATAGSDPLLLADTPLDTDGDGQRNYVDNDDDGDGLLDNEEIALGTDPLDTDTDNDGLIDGAEVNTWDTDPLVADADVDADRVPDIEDAFAREDHPGDVNLDETNPDVYGSRDNIRNEIKDIIDRNALRDDIQDMIDDTNIRNLDARMEQATDAQTGKVLTDRQGFRVRIEQYVLRPDSYTVQLLNISLRTQEAGSLAGLNTLDWTTRFHQSLDALTGGQLRDLPWNEYLLGSPVKYGTTQPGYYPDWTQVRLDNSQGNTFMEKKDFDNLQYSSSKKWHQDILWDKVSFDQGSNWYNFSTGNINGGSNPDGFSIDPSGLGSSYDVDVRFYVINDNGALVNAGDKGFDNIWEFLAVNMPRASSESAPHNNQRNIGNNNLEIRLSSKFGGSQVRDVDLIYVPWNRQTWNTSHSWGD